MQPCRTLLQFEDFLAAFIMAFTSLEIYNPSRMSTARATVARRGIGQSDRMAKNHRSQSKAHFPDHKSAANYADSSSGSNFGSESIGFWTNLGILAPPAMTFAASKIYFMLAPECLHNISFPPGTFRSASYASATLSVRPPCCFPL